jgi:hypothetical protein
MMNFVIPAAIAALGAGMNLFGHSKKGQVHQMSPFSSGQQGAMQQLLSQGLQNANFQGIEDRARKQFSENTIPSLAERFTSMGAGGQGSSAFAGSLGQAGSDLESQLGAMRGQFGLQQLGMGLSPMYENIYEKGGPGGMQQAGGALAGLGSNVLGMQALGGNMTGSFNFGDLFGGRQTSGGGKYDINDLMKMFQAFKSSQG